MGLKMTIDEVYQFFGSLGKASKITGIQRNTIWNWTQRGYVPFKQQKKIEEITKRKLIASKKHAKKPDCDDEDENNNKPIIYLPKFRYYDDKYGMCEVESLHFRKDRCPKITYKVKGKPREKFSSFDIKRLTQASNLTDDVGELLFESDICNLKNGKKIVFSFSMKEKIENIKFKIIGNTFKDYFIKKEKK